MDGFAGEPAHRERVVAHHLGVHAEARATGEPAVGRIFRILVGRHGGALTIGGGGHHQTHEFPHIPAALTEFHGQPVEQCGMAGQFAADAEVAGGAHEAGAE